MLAMSQCEHTVHRTALVPSASLQNLLLTNLNSIWRHLLPSGDFQASRDRDADRLRSRDDRSPPSHPAINRGRERAASPVPGEGSAPATAPSAIYILRRFTTGRLTDDPTRAGNKGQCRAKTARSRQRSRQRRGNVPAMAPTRDKLRWACRHRLARAALGDGSSA